jgi:hypothetical protein
VRVTDASSQTADKPLSLTVIPPSSIPGQITSQ